MAEAKPGILALLGSGETAPTGRRVHEQLFKKLTPPIRVAILETPAGFELNSAYVAGRVAEFLQNRLRNYHPEINVIPARRKGTTEGPDNPKILGPLLKANYIFMGAGSPTYTTRNLADTRAWHTIVARHRLGATLCIASAAAIAIGNQTLPVYEIYKVGEDPHWRPGLDLLSPYGLKIIFVTHWNNTEGGENLDTSRCYMGRPRMEYLLSLLPDGVTLVGIDEHTALIVDSEPEVCSVMGRGGVTLLHAGQEEVYPSGSTFPLTRLGTVRWPVPEEGIPESIWREVLASQVEDEEEEDSLPEEVVSLIESREVARQRQDWDTADALRERLATLGYQVVDTPQGPQWERLDI